jgi:hypothetical protein
MFYCNVHSVKHDLRAIAAAKLIRGRIQSSVLAADKWALLQQHSAADFARRRNSAVKNVKA